MMATTYDVGDLVRLTAVFTDMDGTIGDPDVVRFSHKAPDGTVTSQAYSTSTGSIVRDSTGTYHVDLPATGRGVYWTRWCSTGSIVTAEETSFVVRMMRTAT